MLLLLAVPTIFWFVLGEVERTGCSPVLAPKHQSGMGADALGYCLSE